MTIDLWIKLRVCKLEELVLPSSAPPEGSTMILIREKFKLTVTVRHVNRVYTISEVILI